LPATITLSATLQNIFGAAASTNARLRLTLCGFDGTQPRIPGTALLAEVREEQVFTGNAISVSVVPNDAISPAGTYYCVQVFDAAGNCVASQNYQILSTGGSSQDLSNLTPFTIMPWPAGATGAWLTPQGIILMDTDGSGRKWLLRMYQGDWSQDPVTS
jgi:hypothetical protein